MAASEILAAGLRRRGGLRHGGRHRLHLRSGVRRRRDHHRSESRADRRRLGRGRRRGIDDGGLLSRRRDWPGPGQGNGAAHRCRIAKGQGRGARRRHAAAASRGASARSGGHRWRLSLRAALGPAQRRHGAGRTARRGFAARPAGALAVDADRRFPRCRHSDPAVRLSRRAAGPRGVGHGHDAAVGRAGRRAGQDRRPPYGPHRDRDGVDRRRGRGRRHRRLDLTNLHSGERTRAAAQLAVQLAFKGLARVAPGSPTSAA